MTDLRRGVAVSAAAAGSLAADVREWDGVAAPRRSRTTVGEIEVGRLWPADGAGNLACSRSRGAAWATGCRKRHSGQTHYGTLRNSTGFNWRSPAAERGARNRVGTGRQGSHGPRGAGLRRPRLHHGPRAAGAAGLQARLYS